MSGKTMIVIGVLALASACSSPYEVGKSVGVDAPATASAETSQQVLDRRIAKDAEPMEFKDEATRGRAVRDFNYAWPKEASAIPGLVSLLMQRRDEALVAQKSEWESALAEFGDSDCVSCVNRGFGTTWEALADLPRFLSLSAERYAYTGGAHGNSDFDALVWDREANNGLGEGLDPLDLFVGEYEFGETVRGPYCEALIAKQNERRGNAGMADAEMLAACPALDELTIIVGSSNGQTFDRIGLLAAPYVAGSYAEGPYEVTLPVTERVLQAVKPEYLDAFSIAE
ncbi:MAG: hypothetical protein AAF941_05730 [Pseudomonadota bacterium]